MMLKSDSTLFLPGLPIRINTGPDGVEAFFIEVVTNSTALGCAEGSGWTGIFVCTLDDPVGVIQIAGVGNGTGILEVANITMDSLSPLLYARVETIGPQHHVTMETKAGYFGHNLPLPSIPSLPLVDLSTALKAPGNQTLFDSLVLVHQQRLLDQTMFYSTDSEVTLMIRLTDRTGAPDNTQSGVHLLIDPDPGISGAVWADGQTTASMQLWIPAPFYEDGWYGVQFRGAVPYMNVSISVAVETYDRLGNTGPTRRIVYGSIPFVDTVLPQSTTAYAMIQLGALAPPCPWEARFPSVIATTAVVYVVGQLTKAQLSTLPTTIACALNVPARRVSLTANGNQITLTVQVESFLRAYDVNLAILSPTQLSIWFGNLTLLSIERRSKVYQSDPANPPTPCPPHQYFTSTGAFRAIPKHSTVTPDCYGFKCVDGYALVASLNQCVPAYVPDSVYWTVVGLVTGLIIAVLSLSCLVKLVIASNIWIHSPSTGNTQEKEKEERIDATLPIAVTAHGELVFELVGDNSETDEETTEESSTSGDESS